jgi:hypothetical protein
VTFPVHQLVFVLDEDTIIASADKFQDPVRPKTVYGGKTAGEKRCLYAHGLARYARHPGQWMAR